MTKNILFICKNNRFRSKIAEAYFNKINKNKQIKISSSGLFEGFPIDRRVKNIAKTLEIFMKGKPRPTSIKMLIKQDLVILIANDVPANLFKKEYVKKMIVWKTKDLEVNGVKKMDKEGVIKIIRDVIKNVDKLNKDLEIGRIKL
jgi:protein-tyrosine-phosphatase